MEAKRKTNYSLTAGCPSSRVEGKQSCRLRKYCFILTKDNLLHDIFPGLRVKFSLLEQKAEGSNLSKSVSSYHTMPKWCKRGGQVLL